MQVKIPKFVESQVGSEREGIHRIKIYSGNYFILENIEYRNEIL